MRLRDGRMAVPQSLFSRPKLENHTNPRNEFMRRIGISVTAAILMAALAAGASAQSQSPAPAPAPSMQAPAAAGAQTAKPSRMKLTREKLKDMRAKWKANRPKLKACRAEVKKQGLAGDDRWFFIEDCMAKS
jgi:hypothetical protein